MTTARAEWLVEMRGEQSLRYPTRAEALAEAARWPVSALREDVAGPHATRVVRVCRATRVRATAQLPGGWHVEAVAEYVATLDPADPTRAILRERPLYAGVPAQDVL